MDNLPRELIESPARFLETWFVPSVQAHPIVSGELKDVAAVMEIDLLDDKGHPVEVWQVAVEKGSARLAEGDKLPPSFILKMHSEDWKALLTGELRAEAALIDGRLRISGDLGLAMLLSPLLFDSF